MSVEEPKKHLGDHVCISDKEMEKTDLCWRIPVGPGETGVCNVTEQRSVWFMAKHVTDAGVVNVYAKIHADYDFVDSAEDDFVENAPEHHDYYREDIPE